MEFEFDPKKSDSNKRKHGIDFEEAKQIWRDFGLTEIIVSSEEPRRLVIGKIAERHWTAVVTDRGVKTRIISVRRSREREVKHYEEDIRKGV